MRYLPLVLLLVLVLIPAPAQASGVLTGCNWGNRSVARVFIGPAVKSDHWRVRNAMSVWNSISRGQPKLWETAYPSRAQIEVRAYRNYANQETIATTGGTCGQKMIVKINIAYFWPAKAYTVVPIHELGHAFGLAHRPRQYGNSVMYPTLWGMTWGPTLLDRRTLGGIYD